MKNILQPMADFALAQGESSTFDKSQIDFYDEELGKLHIIRNYAKFLKQPLQLGMFVPCDEKGNVLVEPKRYAEWLDQSIDASEETDLCIQCALYHEAKDRVLFEGFELKDKYSNGQMYLNDWFVYKGVLHEDYDYKAPEPINKNI